MTVEDVQRRLATIRTYALKGDHEAAHSCEDSLNEDVLLAIADGRCVDPAGVAREALRSSDIEFNRWCA